MQSSIVLVSKLSVLVIILVVLYQDMKSREVSFILFPMLFLLNAYITGTVKPIEMVVSDMLMILGFITIQLLVIVLYLLLKFRKVINPFSGFIGTGDLLFWLAIAPLFSFINFVLFFVLSLSFSAIAFITFKSIFKPESITKSKFIPLAGMQAGFLFLMLLFDQLFHQLEFHQRHFISNFWQI